MNQLATRANSLTNDPVIYVSVLNTNSCSSEHKLNYLMYYVDNLSMKFSFIGISETWAIKHNDHIIIIYNYNHEQCIPSNKSSLYIHNSIQPDRLRESHEAVHPVHKCY